MRIISETHDFYDVVQASGQDQTLLYLRNPEDVELEKWSFPELHGGNHWRRDLYIDEQIIGFCGKIYPVLSLSLSYPQKTFCFNIEDVDRFVEDNYKHKAVEGYRSKDKRWWKRRNWVNVRRVDFERYFTQCTEQQTKFVDMFLVKRCPIFVASRSYRHDCMLTYNAQLKTLEFFRVIDPFTAFQEISMFLGSLATPEKPLPKIDDKTMAEAKGFNKWSFRKPPKE